MHSPSDEHTVRFICHYDLHYAYLLDSWKYTQTNTLRIDTPTGETIITVEGYCSPKIVHTLTNEKLIDFKVVTD